MTIDHIWLQGHQYDEVLTSLGFTHLTDTIWCADQAPEYAEHLMAVLDTIDPFGYIAMVMQ